MLILIIKKEKDIKLHKLISNIARTFKFLLLKIRKNKNIEKCREWS